MVSNDQSEDAHAANGLVLNNNVSYKGKQAGGTAKDLIKLGTDDILKISQLRYQDLTSDSTKEGIFIQSGWSFIEDDGTVASSKAITFPTAFTTVLGVFVSGNGQKASGADPTVITEGTQVNLSDSVDLMIATYGLTTSGFNVVDKRVAASSGAHYIFSW